jgi:hypothetical protein
VNPPGEMRTARLCSSAFGGVCQQDEMFDKCSTGFINIYRAFQTKHLQTPKELPSFVTVRVGAESEDLIACKFYGRGERAFFVDAVKHCDGGEEWVSLKEMDGHCVITNGHQLLRRLLARVDRGVDEVDLKCFALHFRPVASEGFEARIGDEKLSSTISLSVVKRANHKRKQAPKDCVELPFGIYFVPDANPVDAKPLPEPEPLSPDSDDEDAMLNERDEEEGSVADAASVGIFSDPEDNLVDEARLPLSCLVFILIFVEF